MSQHSGLRTQDHCQMSNVWAEGQTCDASICSLDSVGHCKHYFNLCSLCTRRRLLPHKCLTFAQEEGLTAATTRKSISSLPTLVLSSLKGKERISLKKFKPKGGEELEKIKQNNGLTSWNVTSLTKQSTRRIMDQLPVT